MSELKELLEKSLGEICDKMGWRDDTILSIFHDAAKEMKLLPAVVAWVARYAHDENLECGATHTAVTAEEELAVAVRIEECLEKAFIEAKVKRETAERIVARSKGPGWTFYVLPGVEVYNSEGQHLTPETAKPGIEVRIGGVSGTLELKQGQYIMRANHHLHVIAARDDPRDGVLRLWCTTIVNLAVLDRIQLSK